MGIDYELYDEFTLFLAPDKRFFNGFNQRQELIYKGIWIFPVEKGIIKEGE